MSITKDNIIISVHLPPTKIITYIRKDKKLNLGEEISAMVLRFGYSKYASI